MNKEEYIKKMSPILERREQLLSEIKKNNMVI